MTTIAELFPSVYETTLCKRANIYCSTPITSGKLYADWLKKIDRKYDSSDSIAQHYIDSHKKEVVELNRQYAQGFVERIRTKTEVPVINPAAMPHIDNWKDSDWLDFWESVITTYARFVVFADGWEYSNGCTYEFLVAQLFNIECFDENLSPIGLVDGIELIKTAIIILKENNGVTIGLERNLALLKPLNLHSIYPKLNP